LDAAQGQLTANVSQSTLNGTPIYMSQLNSSFPISSSAAGAAAVNANDNKQPYTDSYSFTIAQKLPWSSLMEVSYVGNASNDLQNTGNVGVNINLIPVGAMLSGVNGGADPNALNQNPFRPIKGFGDLALVDNNLYANYNSMQITWMRTKGRYTINMNYTYGKAMGSLYSNNQFSVAENYGIQSADRRQIFNAAYSIELGSPMKNKAAGALVNGWQLSGITQIESGANLSGNNGGSFGMNLSVNGVNDIVPGSVTAQTPNGINISNLSILGTPDINLTPTLTCNPTSGLAAHQYVNGACFGLPSSVGANGPSVIPAVYGPAFFNSDLGLFKNFAFGEKKKLQIRINGYNFLNHPLWSFPGGNNLTLNLNQAGQNVNTDFGYATQKQGHRVMQLAAKFYF